MPVCVQPFAQSMSGDTRLARFRQSKSSCRRRKEGRLPELSKRRNLIVIADEAHRSQYDLIDGLARRLYESAALLRIALRAG